MCLLVIPLSLVAARSLSTSHLPGPVNLLSRTVGFEVGLHRRMTPGDRVGDDWVVVPPMHPSTAHISPLASPRTPLLQASSRTPLLRPEAKSRGACAAYKKLGDNFVEAMLHKGYSGRQIEVLKRACCKISTSFCLMGAATTAIALENAPNKAGLVMIGGGAALGLSGIKDIYAAGRPTMNPTTGGTPYHIDENHFNQKKSQMESLVKRGR